MELPTAPRISAHRKPLGFFKHLTKNKNGFFQFLAMSGVLLLSCRSLSQKYQIHNLTEDIASLKEEQESIASRMERIKQDLSAQAALEPTGAFGARLRVLFGQESN